MVQRALLYGGSFLTIASRYLVLAVSPVVFVHGGASQSSVGLLVGLAFLVQTIASPVLGRLSDHRGHKLALILGAAGMALAGGTVYFFPDMAGFITGQVLFGLGSAAFFAAAFSVVSEQAPPGQRASELARFGIVINVAEAAGPPAGMALLFTGRPLPFLLTGLIAASGVLAFGGLQPVSTGDSTNQGEPGPLVPRSWWLPLVSAATLALSYGVINAYLPQRALRHGANAGWFFAANFGVQILLRIFASDLLDQYPRAVLLGLGAACIAVATITVGFLPFTLILLASGLLYGAGSYAVMPSLLAELAARSESRQGESMAAYNASFGSGVAVGSMVLGPALATVYGGGFAFTVAGLLALIGLISWVFKSSSKPTGVGTR